MDELMEFIRVLTILGIYGVGGTASGVLMYRTLVTRGNAPGTENLGPAALMAGVFWPVGLFIGMALYLTTPKLKMRDQREIRRRENEALRKMRLLQVREMEHTAEKAEAALELEIDAFRDQRIRALEARVEDAREDAKRGKGEPLEGVIHSRKP